MNFRKFRFKFRLMTALLLGFVFCVCSARAQVQPQAPDNNAPQVPIPPVTPDTTGSANDNQGPVAAGVVTGGLNSDVVNSNIQPGSEPLASVQTSGIVSPTGGANVLDPSINVSIGPDTGIVPGQTNADIIFGGTLAFDHFWRRNEFSTMYSGGYNVYTPVSGNNSQYHILSVADVSEHGRITLRFRDDFSDSSGSVFGGLSTGGPGLVSTAGFIGGLSPTFTVSQVILTSNANRIGDTALGEFDYALSRHATLTFAGSYELLHYLTAGYVNSHYEDGRVGYSFQVDRRNSVGLTYDYNYTGFDGISSAVASQTVAVAYGLKLSGRLSFQVSGGPQFIYTQNTGSGSNQWSWSVASALIYQRRRTTYNLSYSHGLTNGSGVFLGALSDTVQGSITTVVHRVWTPSITGGYSSSNNLEIDSTLSTFYGNYYGTVALDRIWGRTLHTTASYGIQQQTTNSAACPVASCTPTGIRQVFTITLGWHPLPVNLQ